MYRIKFLLSVFLGTAVYVVLSVFMGPESMLVQKQLEQQKYLLHKNVQKIQLINENLSMDYLSLRVDAEVIAGHAKRLGYIDGNEKIIKLTGIPYTSPLTVEAGTPITLEKIPYTSEWVCKLCGLLTFLFTSLLFFANPALKVLKKRRRYKELVKTQGYIHENPQI